MRPVSTLHRSPVTDPASPPERLVASIETVIRGKTDVVRLVVGAFLAGGHVLLEDVPGVGKTTLAEALARSVGGTFRRIQCTSDMLPADILGVNLWNPDARQFEFRKGPIFANLVLADEINRTTPKTQSALLESMAEATVTVDDRGHQLPDPFFVIATQNPSDHAGTFPLPDSQLDRFMLRTRMGYPAAAEEVAILRAGGRTRIADIEPALSLDEVRQIRESVTRIAFADELAGYLVAIVAATRDTPAITGGASPRASMDLYRAAQVRALMEGRAHVVPDDIKAMVIPVLGHRLALREDRSTEDGGRRIGAILRAIVDSVPVPA